jgi:hypothetical protein
MGANDPIRTTTEPMSDALVAAVTGAIGMTLADREAGGVLANPVLSSGFISKGSFEKALAAQIVRVAWGVDKYITTAEGDDFTILDLASDKATVTPARMGFARQMSDMARSFDSWGILDYARFAADGTIGWQQTMLSTIAALATSLSETGGATGADATWGAVLSDFMTLGAANVAGPYVMLCRPKDWGNIAEDAYALGGRVAQSAETDKYLRASNPGFKGVFMGGDLWIYTTSEVPVSAGDTVSMMFGSGCVAWDAHMPAPSRSTNPLLWTPLFGVETDRIPLKSEDYIAYSTHLGASLDINAAGIQMPFLT